MSRRKPSKKIINEILEKQNNKCANTPNNDSINLKGYDCLLWITNFGYFDESGYDIDHIVEHCFEKDDTKENLQALCPNCHSVKTKRFMKQTKPTDMPRYNSVDLHQGRAYMDIVNDKQASKKRKIK